MLIKVYYKSVDGAIIVYDITDDNTFESIFLLFFMIWIYKF